MLFTVFFDEENAFFGAGCQDGVLVFRQHEINVNSYSDAWTWSCFRNLVRKTSLQSVTRHHLFEGTGRGWITPWVVHKAICQRVLLRDVRVEFRAVVAESRKDRKTFSGHFHDLQVRHLCIVVTQQNPLNNETETRRQMSCKFCFSKCQPAI